MKYILLFSTILILITLIISSVHCGYVEIELFKDSECKVSEETIVQSENTCIEGLLMWCNIDKSKINVNSFINKNCTGELISNTTIVPTSGKCDTEIGQRIGCTDTIQIPTSNGENVVTIMYYNGSCTNFKNENIVYLESAPTNVCLSYDDGTSTMNQCTSTIIKSQSFNGTDCSGEPISFKSYNVPFTQCSFDTNLNAKIMCHNPEQNTQTQ